jgi:hypothetical protein
MKNYSDTIGNQARNLPACSAVPQPTASPSAPESLVNDDKIRDNAVCEIWVTESRGELCVVYCGTVLQCCSVGGLKTGRTAEGTET